MPNSISETPPESGIERKRVIRDFATAEGFDAVGFARAQSPPGAADDLKAYLAAGHHGAMEWMATTAERRADPAKLWPEAKSVITLAINYAPERNPLDAPEAPSRAAISVYAQGEDYHEVVKRKLKRVARWLVQRYGGDVKVFVDTAPVMEKPMAQMSGLGWQGKHTNLVSRDYGSWLFLGSIFTTLELPPNDASDDHCGQCHACLDICPTNAFPAPYRIDARRCISYLTIEHKGHIAEEFRDAIGNRIYGCDDCLAVCPWNKFAQSAREAAFAPRESLVGQSLADLASLDDAAFRARFSKSPIKRVGRDRFVRNVLIAVGNAQDPSLAMVAEKLADDSSPLVRAMAAWALRKLLPKDAFARRAEKYGAKETDPEVAAEWRNHLSAGISAF
jgi:epoxyqueuosine reductase